MTPKRIRPGIRQSRTAEPPAVPASTPGPAASPHGDLSDARIARIFEQILGIDTVGTDADFFALGGQSLKAMQLLMLINESFSTDLQFGDLADNATPRAIARLIDSARERHAPQPILQRRDHDEPAFITPGQLLFWRLATQEELASYFNLRQALMLHGALDVEALRAALQALSDRHESLRMHFLPGSDPDDVQLVIPRMQPVVWSTLHAPADVSPTDFTRELMQRELERPFNLLREPLVRYTLVRFSATLHALVLTMHHLITDAWSFNVLRRELNSLYVARIQGQPDSLPAVTIRYSDYAYWIRRLHETEPYRAQRRYWDSVFSTLGPVTTDLRPATGESGPRSGTGYADLSLSDRDFTRILQRSAASQTTPYVVLQAVMHLALYRTFPELDRMLVLSPVAERYLPELQNSVGLHITIVGILSTITADLTLRDFILQLKRNAHDAMEHYESRQFALYDLSRRRQGDFPLIVYNFFALQNDCGWTLGDLQVEPVLPPEDPRPYVTLLELYHARGMEGLWGQLKYDLAQVGDRAVQSFVSGYRDILEAVVSGTDDAAPVFQLVGR